MSVQLIAWALETSAGSVSRKAVLIALANAANHHTGLCCPSLKRLAKETDLSVSTVQRAIEGLIELGPVAKTERQRTNGSNTSNAYTFPTTPYGHHDHPPLVTVTTPEPEEGTGSEPTPAAAPRVSRKHPMWDPIWDVLTDGFGPVTTKDGESRRAKAVKALVEAGATPEDVIARGKRWRKHFPGATLTQEALVKWWDTLPRKELR